MTLDSKAVAFKNLIVKPEGSDVISENAAFYFNTLFFDPDFSPTTGFIHEGERISSRPPIGTRIGISENGSLKVFHKGTNQSYSDVIQVPFLLSYNSKVNKTFTSLNFRHFLCISRGQLIYVTGYGNSLISWADVKALMAKLRISSVIALDGGTSLNYYFKGENNTYRFSSIPFRDLWVSLNSPYYLSGEKL